MKPSMGNTTTVSSLRQRMIEDMAARKLDPHAAAHLQLQAVRRLAKPSPDTADAGHLSASIGPSRRHPKTCAKPASRCTKDRQDLDLKARHTAQLR
jgi:hypothetical protein